MSSTVISKVSFFPASGWFRSKVSVSSPTSVMVACMFCPCGPCSPTTIPSFGSGMFLAASLGTSWMSCSLCSPYACSGVSVNSLVSPFFIPWTASSNPLMSCPPPTSKSSVCPCFLLLSKTVPSSSVPV